MTISNTDHAFAIVFGFSLIQMTIFFHLSTLNLTQTELLLDLVSLETRSWFWQQYPYLQHKGEQRAKILSTKGETAASWKEPVVRPLEETGRATAFCSSCCETGLCRCSSGYERTRAPCICVLLARLTDCLLQIWTRYII